MTLLYTFLFFLIVMALMAIGVMMKRKAIQGSCGGLANVDVDRLCNCETVCEEHDVEKQLYQIEEPSKPTE
ncbi:(Na+)-NQR maturation NqrM [Vibrio sp. RC27]